MPQLSIETYVTQYFWLVVILFTFYYLSATKFLPKIAELLKTRKKIESEASNVSLSSVDNINFATGKSIISEILSISSLSVTSPKTSGFDKIFNSANQTWVKNSLKSSK